MRSLHTSSLGIILLAAGSSSRLGRPKQAVEYEGITLLERSVDAALRSVAEIVVVVLGAENDRFRETLSSETHIVINAEWKEGMSSSIRKGLHAMREFRESITAVIIMVCDQPFVDATILNRLVHIHQETGKPIVASGYDNTFGPPVLFDHILFDELMKLSGDKGARTLVAKFADLVEIVPFPKGSIDIDTEADYEKIKTSASR